MNDLERSNLRMKSIFLLDKWTGQTGNPNFQRRYDSLRSFLNVPPKVSLHEAGPEVYEKMKALCGPYGYAIYKAMLAAKGENDG